MERADLTAAIERSLGRRPVVAASSSPVLIADSSTEEFRARFATALAGTGEIFLGSPAWTPPERAAAEDFVRQGQRRAGDRGWLMLPTGGSSGTVRYARHDGETMAVAVRGFMAHFGLPKANALGVLPLFHVSGLMAWMRCAITGGDFVAGDWQGLSSGVRPVLPDRPDGWLLSLVPTQLERLLAQPGGIDWLRRFRIILVGGAPAWPALLDRAAEAALPVSTGYGMTETAAMVTAVLPEEFLRGDRSSGRALPHARVTVGTDGAIAVSGESLSRGYFPNRVEERTFVTGDLGQMDGDGRLRVLGRRDGVIITGGEKVLPDEVEAILRGTGEFSAVAVIGLPHPDWGQEVVAVHGPGPAPDLAKVQRALNEALGRFKHPKRYWSVPVWPTSDNGKLRRGELIQLLDNRASRST